MRSLAVGGLRWRVKKAARAGVSWAAWASGSLVLREALGRASVRVLTYHRFAEVPQDPFALPPARFAEQMACLAAERRAISLEQLGAFLRGAGGIPAGSVLVTIDDGFRSTHREALPVLAAHGIPAVAFVTTTLVGNARAAERQPEPYMGWEELRELEAAGVAIGSHSHTHRSLGPLAPETVRDELRRSRDALAGHLAGPIDAFAYPFGTRSDYHAGTRRALGEAGFRYGFTSRHGAVRAGMDPAELPRVKVESGEGLSHFRRLCRGGMDAWQLADDLLFRLQREREEQPVEPGAPGTGPG